MDMLCAIAVVMLHICLYISLHLVAFVNHVLLLYIAVNFTLVTFIQWYRSKSIPREAVIVARGALF